MEVKQDLLDWLVDECKYTTEEVENMSSYELVKAWLEYEGIIGYTSMILEVIECAYEEQLEGLKF